MLEAVDPALPLKDCIESPAVWEYRNKMEFSFGDEVKDGPLTLGLHKRSSFYDILEVPQCQIVHRISAGSLKKPVNSTGKKGLRFIIK